jgi:hypothetical protein
MQSGIAHVIEDKAGLYNILYARNLFREYSLALDVSNFYQRSIYGVYPGSIK